MIILVLKRYISALLICMLLSIPGFAAAEDEPMTMSSPQNTQQGDMSNHKNMDHNGMMMDHMDGMKNKSQTKKPSKDSNTNNNSNTSMPMENDM